MSQHQRTARAFWLRPLGLSLVVAVCLLLIVAVQVWEIRFSPRSSTTATTVELVTADSSATLLGVEVRAIGNFMPAEVTEADRDRIVAQCGSDFDGLRDTPGDGESILRNPVVVLHVAVKGDLCFEEGQDADLGAIDITVRSVGRPAPNGQLVNEISVRDSEPWIFIAVTMCTFVMTLFVGAALGVLLDASYRKSELAALDVDVREAVQNTDEPAQPSESS